MNQIPNIKQVEDRLEGTISLPIWKAYQSRQGTYAALDSQEKSNGIFQISIGGDMVSDNLVITNEQVSAYNYITTNSERIHDSILARLLAEYKTLQNDYGYEEDDAKEFMPDVDGIEQFKNLIGLSQVHLMNVSKDGVAYVGYEFGCTWDEEHGMGFMTHMDRVIDMGGADVAFLTWVAEEDLE